MNHQSIAVPTLSLMATLAAQPAFPDPSGIAPTSMATWLAPAPDSAWRLFETPAIEPPDVRVEEFGARVLGTERLELGLTSRRSSGLYDPPAQRWNQTDVGLFTIGRAGGARLGARWSTLLDPDTDTLFQGLRGDLAAGYVARFGERFDIHLGLGTTWTDADYWNGRHARLSPALAPVSGDGFRDASLQIGACYRFTQHWSVGARLGYRHYMETPASGIAGAPVEQGDFVSGIQLNYRLTNTQPPASGLFSDPCGDY